MSVLYTEEDQRTALHWLSDLHQKGENNAGCILDLIVDMREEISITEEALEIISEKCNIKPPQLQR